MRDIAEHVDGLPNISGREEHVEEAIRASRADRAFLPRVPGASVRSTAPSPLPCTCTSHPYLWAAGSFGPQE